MRKLHATSPLEGTRPRSCFEGEGVRVAPQRNAQLNILHRELSPERRGGLAKLGKGETN